MAPFLMTWPPILSEAKRMERMMRKRGVKLIGWLIDWLTDWLIDWLIDGWMDGWMDGWILVGLLWMTRRMLLVTNDHVDRKTAQLRIRPLGYGLSAPDGRNGTRRCEETKNTTGKKELLLISWNPAWLLGNPPFPIGNTSTNGGFSSQLC